jgi:hypothetical protein
VIATLEDYKAVRDLVADVMHGTPDEIQAVDELRALELHENAERLDLDSYEASKQRLAEIRAAEGNRADSAQFPKGG